MWRFLESAVAGVLMLASILGWSQSRTNLSGVRESVRAKVKGIQKFDYEGNRGALKMLFDDLDPNVNDRDLAKAIRYWRGFAMWRRAINGFNESPLPGDLTQDLDAGVNEFDAALKLDPNFLEAKIGKIGALGYLAYLHRTGPPLMNRYVDRFRPLVKQALAEDPNNPRLLWVLGPGYWSRTLEQGGGEEKAFEAYNRGLAAIRERKQSDADALMPNWGEPELLMNLAWSNLNRKQPDLTAAESYAQAAIMMVPNWHYVRDILIPQIGKAKRAKQAELTSRY